MTAEITSINLPLSIDEETVLLLAEEGESLMAIGRWEYCVRSLTARGFLYEADPVNFFITDAGRAAVASQTKRHQDDMKDALRNNAKTLTIEPDKVVISDQHTPGPHLIDGHLFFVLLDGSTVVCNCIGETVGWEIVALWKAR